MPQIAAAIAGTLEHSDDGLAICELAQRLTARASLRTLGFGRCMFEALSREVVHRTTHTRAPAPSPTSAPSSSAPGAGTRHDRSKHDGAIGGRPWRQT